MPKTQKLQAISPETDISFIDNTPSTPKKKPRYVEESETSRKIKSITKMTEKESNSSFYTILVVLWFAICSVLLVMALNEKIQKVNVAAKQEIATCQSDFNKNNCDRPVKGALLFCEEKKKCKEQHLEQIMKKRTNYVAMAGEMAFEFSSAAGVVVVCLGLILTWICLRQKGKEKTITTVQFYE